MSLLPVSKDEPIQWIVTCGRPWWLYFYVHIVEQNQFLNYSIHSVLEWVFLSRHQQYARLLALNHIDPLRPLVRRRSRSLCASSPAWAAQGPTPCTSGLGHGPRHHGTLTKWFAIFGWDVDGPSRIYVVSLGMGIGEVAGQEFGWGLDLCQVLTCDMQYIYIHIVIRCN